MLKVRGENEPGNKIGQIIVSESIFDYIFINVKNNKIHFNKMYLLNVTNN